MYDIHPIKMDLKDLHTEELRKSFLIEDLI